MNAPNAAMDEPISAIAPIGDSGTTKGSRGSPTPSPSLSAHTLSGFLSTISVQEESRLFEQYLSVTDVSTQVKSFRSRQNYRLSVRDVQA